MRVLKYVTAIVAGLIVLSLATSAQVKNFVPVTTEMLRNPSPEDWLMFSRTYDAQRFSPLRPGEPTADDDEGFRFGRHDSTLRR